MDWDKLRIFHAVAEAGSFTHAGETLNLSQSAISRQISTLEDSVGVPLFLRHARGLILTEQGDLLFRAVREVFARLSMVEGQLSDSRASADGPLSVTVAEFIGSTWLAPLLAEFRQENPGIRLSLLLDDRIYNLGLREADAAIRLYRPEQSDLIQSKIATIGFSICASKDYLKRNGVPKSAEDLKAHTLIGYPPEDNAPFADPNWLLRVAGVVPDAADSKLILLNSIYGICRTAGTGAGIAVLPDYLIAQDKSLEIVLPHLKRPPVEMYYVYPEERRHSRRIGIFRDYLVRHIVRQVI